jgi:hypothetical protein
MKVSKKAVTKQHVAPTHHPLIVLHSIAAVTTPLLDDTSIYDICVCLFVREGRELLVIVCHSGPGKNPKTKNQCNSCWQCELVNLLDMQTAVAHHHVFTFHGRFSFCFFNRRGLFAQTRSLKYYVKGSLYTSRIKFELSPAHFARSRFLKHYVKGSLYTSRI